MNEEIHLSTTFRGHSKRKHLVHLLGFGAEVYLIDLWLRVAMDSPSGHLASWDEEDIADACGWEKDPMELVNKLIESLWLEEDDNGEYHLLDWNKNQPGITPSHIFS